MEISKYFNGESSLSSAVVLNIIAVTLIGLGFEYLVSEGHLPKIKSAKSIGELGLVLIYYVLVLPFDYVIWVCAKNAKNKIYFFMGKLFALKHVGLLAVVLFQFFSN